MGCDRWNGEYRLNNINPIFQFLRDKSAAGVRTALITLIAVTGASTRNPGAHMAVCENGDFSGSFSGGCVEAAVVAEALEVIEAQKPREVRFGAGSPYLDIRLPCGGGIDLFFCPVSDPAIAAGIWDAANDRHPLTIRMDRDSGALEWAFEEQAQAVRTGATIITVNHLPAARVIVLGHGASVESLALLTTSYGMDCHILTPDGDIVGRAQGHQWTAAKLNVPSSTPLFSPDRWTACIFYFHDHDWEGALMQQALHSEAFYVGAMGSFQTHDTRKAMLRDMGVSAEDIDRMSAPIGLIPSTRDPATLALSTLSEVVERYHRQFSRSHRSH